jgi:hypothetical protein
MKEGRSLQAAPLHVAVYLVLPDDWARFDAPVSGIEVPSGVEIIRRERDEGPASKAIWVRNHPLKSAHRLIYCDDDWIYPQGWAKALLSCGRDDEAVAGSGFNVDRLKRRSDRRDGPYVDIAQGFAGVCIRPEWVCQDDIAPPPSARLADDIWLSGQLARQGIAIRLCPQARRGMVPAFVDAQGLQDIDVPGQTRREVYQAALTGLTERYGIWPPVSADR